MPTVERQFSDFLRRPNEVVAELEEHSVVLRRRDAPALRLALEAREEQQQEALQGIARLVQLLLRLPNIDQQAIVQEAFPWVTFLTATDREAFVRELVEVMTGSADLHNFAPLAQLLHEWRQTAELHADPALANRLQIPLDPQGDQVPRP